MLAAVRMLLALLLALSDMYGNARADDTDRLTVFAAASLKGALDDVANAWAAGSGRAPRMSYAATSALARQIEQGAPADIFVSADARWMDWLQQHDHIVADTRRDLLSNTLVLIEPAGRSTTLALADGDDWMRALGDGRLAVARVDSVPAGTYARDALMGLGVWPMLEPHLAQTEDVRQALMFVDRGEVPLGIVYRTDARSGAGVRVVATFPTDSHAAIVYPVAAIDRARANSDTSSFLDFLHGDEAAAIFRKHGFDVLP